MLDLLMPLLARVLTPLFAIGMIGAFLVVVITLQHDVVDFFSEDEPESTPGSNR